MNPLQHAPAVRRPLARRPLAILFAVVLAACLGGLPPHLGHAAPPPANRYHAVTPLRILDTRYGIGRPAGQLSPGEIVDFPLPALEGHAASEMAAVVLTVTAVAPSTVGYLTVWPTGVAQPPASNLNWLPGQNIANQVVTGVGGGRISLYNNNSFTNLVIDAEGWFGADDGSGAGQFRPLMPARILDTRIGLGAPAALGERGSLKLQVTGAGNVPSSGVSAAVLNLTAVSGSQGSFLAAFPGSGPPGVSNLNFAPGQNQAARVIVQLAPDGSVTVYNSAGTVNVLADVSGYFTGGADGTSGGLYVPVTPTRVLDTRKTAGPMRGGQAAALAAGAPAGASSAIVNLTATDTTGGSFLVAYPSGNTRVLASDLNFGPANVIANLGVYKLGGDGGLSLYNSLATTNVLADVEGYFTAVPVSAAAPSAVTGVAAAIHDRGAVLSWTAPAASGGSQVISYTITMGDGSTFVTPASQTSLDLTPLVNTATYQATVTALNGVASGPASAPPTSFQPLGTPDPPSGVSAVAGVQLASVTWQPPANNGGAAILNYEVQLLPEGTVAGTATNSITWGGLSPSPHSFTVRAVNQYGKGPAAGSNSVVPIPINVHKIVVSLNQQHMWVFEGSVLVRESDVTTGRPELPTPAGDYHIFYKTSPYHMVSPWPPGSPFYYNSAWVSYVLEFLEGGYFLHDAPWRSWFGAGSQYGDGTHGCINIPTDVMQWLYGWANLGDEVVVQN